ncbi:hypothetical protein BDQ12DRAFT_672693 [Crucibulum laeve]|uniref:NAD(P)-binding protein n=1 Tax=Crucibulum laeve TaxID=68775 RepID=A0A5C3MK59_9AGAR|nr:hypothetical protein BDQ12DRAFT_672693 [Crucibulum laeve]
MTSIPDDKLLQYADRVKDKVIVITGAANGIGRETALLFAKHGAKIVIGDLDITGAKRVVGEIESAGGQGACIKCNVTVFDEQVAMFDLAIAKYGAVDVVVPNAGIAESGAIGTLQFKNGKPVKPNTATIDVNVIGVLYTVNLAHHYLKTKHSYGDLKALIMIGSMASWAGIPKAEMYSVSKHGILGLMRALHIPLELSGIRVGVIHPFFADTGIVPVSVKLMLAGIPLTPITRVAGAIFYAATDPDFASNGSAWLLPDDGPVFMVPREEFKQGVYKMIDDRANSLLASAKGALYYARLFGDLWHILGKPLTLAGVAAVAAKVSWDNRNFIATYIN